jgi:hypothetical protein
VLADATEVICNHLVGIAEMAVTYMADQRLKRLFQLPAKGEDNPRFVLGMSGPLPFPIAQFRTVDYCAACLTHKRLCVTDAVMLIRVNHVYDPVVPARGKPAVGLELPDLCQGADEPRAETLVVEIEVSSKMHN